MSRAEFVEVERQVTEYGYQDQISYQGVKSFTECKCGWPVPTYLRGADQKTAILEHRLDHLEGRV